MPPTPDRQVPRPILTEEHAMIAAEALHFVGLLCWALKVEVHIEVHDLPRAIFEHIDDFEGADEEEYLSFQDPQRPLWWKRYTEYMILECREPPRS